MQLPFEMISRIKTMQPREVVRKRIGLKLTKAAKRPQRLVPQFTAQSRTMRPNLRLGVRFVAVDMTEANDLNVGIMALVA
jgi:hypothetical protein